MEYFQPSAKSYSAISSFIEADSIATTATDGSEVVIFKAVQGIIPY
jgi:hypothetical protein